jgi:LAO/AO transport system kinase
MELNNDHLDKWLKKRKLRKAELNHDDLFQGIINGHVQALSSAITLLESSKSNDKQVARQLIQSCLPYSGQSFRLGITGVPGVGKSTFIESFGVLAVNRGHKVAVLAVDPSSEKSGGSILGDKTRMNQLSQMTNVFIRPSAAGESLGGVARKTREAIILCEAAGFDFVLIETVGVGQSETAVHSMVDFFLLLMLAGAGDELQGIKRGIMEMADALVITKADGDNRKKSEMAKRSYQNAMHLFPPNSNEWIPQALVVSAIEHYNLDQVFDTIDRFQNQTMVNGWFEKKRRMQDRYWLNEAIRDALLHEFYANDVIKLKLKELEARVVNNELTSFDAADEMLEKFKQIRNED